MREAQLVQPGPSVCLVEPALRDPRGLLEKRAHLVKKVL